jgi:hypothetical protein
MKTPILELIRQQLTAVVFWAEQDAIKAQDLASQALDLTCQAIEAVQGDLEDARRVSGRVPVCTELHSLLAPNELTFEQLIALHPKLEAAYGRLMRLDANGACCTATDIQDAVVYGHLSEPDAERFAHEIEAACDAMERGEE